MNQPTKPMILGEILLGVNLDGANKFTIGQFADALSIDQAKAHLIELLKSLPVEEESWVDDFGMVSTEPLYRPLRAIDFRNALIKAIQGGK